MLVKLFGKSTLGIPNFHGRRGQAKTFAQKYCPGGGNIYSLSLAYFSKFPLRRGLRGWGGITLTGTLLFVIIASLFCLCQIEKFMAKKKADSLRKQQQVYDEFSPNGPITDHEPYMYDDGQPYLGN